jgi:hypothetical protein
VTPVGSALELAKARRKAFEVGQRQAEERVAVLRHELRRWRLEAEWWKAEHDRLHKEFCDVLAYVTGELGLK